MTKTPKPEPAAPAPQTAEQRLRAAIAADGRFNERLVELDGAEQQLRLEEARLLETVAVDDDKGVGQLTEVRTRLELIPRRREQLRAAREQFDKTETSPALAAALDASDAERLARLDAAVAAVAKVLTPVADTPDDAWRLSMGIPRAVRLGHAGLRLYQVRMSFTSAMTAADRGERLLDEWARFRAFDETAPPES